MTKPQPAGENWQSRASLEAHRPCDLMLGMEGRETFALGNYREPFFRTSHASYTYTRVPAICFGEYFRSAWGLNLTP